KSYDDIIEKTLASFLQLVYFFHVRKKERDVFLNTLKNFQNSLIRNKKSYPVSLLNGYLNLCDFIKTFDDTLEKMQKLNSYNTIQFRIWCERVIEEDDKIRKK
ncbi:MAG: hypothetical protein RLZZ546_2948, partial [Bacteroidota bacterium]